MTEGGGPVNELTPSDLLRSRSGEPRPRSAFSSVIATVVAFAAFICSLAALSVTIESQCNDRRDRKTMQQPNMGIDVDNDLADIYLINTGPGAALIKDFKLIYQGKTLSNPSLRFNPWDQKTTIQYSDQDEWAFGMAALRYLREAANLCEGRLIEGCLKVKLDLHWPVANFLIPAGGRTQLLRINNTEEISKRVRSDDFLEWKNQFGWVAYDDIDFQLEYCPVSREFGPCRTITRHLKSSLPELPTCRTGFAGLVPERLWSN